MTEMGSTSSPRGSALLAHELQAPLAILRTRLERALDASWCKGEAESLVRACMEQARDMGQLIVDVLLLEKAEAKQLGGLREEVDLARLTPEVVKSLEPLAETKHLHIELKMETGLRVTGDPGQLKRLLANLVDNAIKYTGSGGKVEVEGRRVGTQVIVIVRDTGMGIPADELHRIFESFYQVDPERSRRESGCGLGLSVARALAETNEGSITVQSTPGKGSRFTFKMRLSR